MVLRQRSRVRPVSGGLISQLARGNRPSAALRRSSKLSARRTSALRVSHPRAGQIQPRFIDRTGAGQCAPALAHSPETKSERLPEGQMTVSCSKSEAFQAQHSRRGGRTWQPGESHPQSSSNPELAGLTTETKTRSCEPVLSTPCTAPAGATAMSPAAICTVAPDAST
jgi:hypothetical protein